MPLYVDAHLIVDKIKDEDNPKAYRESFSDEEIQEVKQGLLDFNSADLLGDNPATYTFSVHDISFIKPTKDLTGIKIPLAELRKAIADKMGAGTSVLDLESLLLLIRTVYRENQD